MTATSPANDRHYLVLGLDPGIASCGFCLLDMTDHKILEMGSHLFKAPQEDKTKVSLAVGRRNARSARRNTKRTADRQKHCLNLLKEAGLVPEDADKQWMQSRKGDKPILKLRNAALVRPLTNRELAQVLYSLSGRRGYIPHGEGKEGTDDDEGKKVLGAIAENKEKMADGGYETVGQYLYSLGKSRNKGGNYKLCVLDSQIVDEARIILDKQRVLGNEALAKMEGDIFESFVQAPANSNKAGYIDILTWEKKTLDYDEKVYQLVGPCVYYPNEKRAANADLSSEMCRAYERLGHLTIITPEGTTKTLTHELREEYIRILFSPAEIKGQKGKVTYTRIRKDLALEARDYFKGVDADSEKNEVFQPKAWRSLRKNGVPTSLLERMRDDIDLADGIGEALTYASSEDSLRAKLEEFDLSDEEIKNLVTHVPFTGKIFKGYGSRSVKALHFLLDMFVEEQIVTLTDAERASGLLDLRLDEASTRTTLLPPYKQYDPTNNNPVVLRALSRMRKIINSIIRIHGVPDEIHIELGRELKHSQREKKMIDQRNLQNRKDRERRKGIIAGILNCDPDDIPGKVLRKYALWEEQDNFDMYTGQKIELERMVTDDRYTEIDHILPYSRTGEDGNRNKVLVLQKSNQDKKERTPYEWMVKSGEAGAPDWNAFKERVFANKKLFKKRAMFLEENLDADKQKYFLSRNLNDTRYMARAVKNYLEQTLAFPEDDGRQRHVVAVAGGATASLRYVWGLNMGANNSKDRSDDRHHAVDAAVIAACNESTIIKVAKEREKGPETFRHSRKGRLRDTQPWPTFAEDVLAKRETIIPTHMVSHGATGQAFEETVYRFEGIKDEKSKRAVLSKQDGDIRITSTEGNYRLDENGSAHLYGKMAFIRFWLNPDGKKGKGEWLVEPVYYAEIEEMKNGTYTPKFIPHQGLGRNAWKTLPDNVLSLNRSFIVHFDDVISVDGQLGRFKGLGTSNLRLKMVDLLYEENLPHYPTFKSWTADTNVFVVEEDVLGHCFQKIDSGETMP